MLRFTTLLILTALLPATAFAAAQETLRWESDLATAQRLAAQTNRLVLVHFWGTWCPPCMEMEKTVFSRAGLGTAIHPYYVPVKIQVEENMNQELVKQFQVDAFPCDIVMTAQGQVVMRSRGFKPADEYVAMLNQAAQQALSQQRPQGAPVAGTTTNANAAAVLNAASTVPAGSASPYAVTPAAAYGASDQRYNTQYTPPATAAAAPAATTTAANSLPGDDRYGYYFQGQQPAPTAPTTATPPQAATTATPPQAATTSTTTATPAASTTGDRYSMPVATPAQTATPATPPSASTTGDRYATDNRYAPPTSSAATVAPPVTNPAPAVSTPNTTPANSVASTATAAAPTPASAPTPATASAPVQTAVIASPAPVKPGLPAGCPPLALDGYCPVSVTEKMVWKEGDVKFGVIHKGHTYLFVSAAEQQKFLANPDAFSPIVSGNDPIEIVEQGRLVPGKRAHGCFCDKRMVLFSSAENFEKFKADQKRYETELQQALQSGKTLRR